MVDSGATRHIYGNRSAFTSYTTVKEGEKQVFMGDSRFTPVIGKGKVLFKLTSGKVFALCDALSCAKYPLELGVSISAWESRSEDIV